MKGQKWGLGLIVMLSLLVIIVACERNITTVEEIVESPVLPAENCFKCHSDEETELVAAAGRWANSAHASGENQRTGSCSVCHTSEGFVALVETGKAPSDIEAPTSIHCFTCHAPHTNANFELRVTEAQELENGESYNLGDANLCTACHKSRRNVNTYVSDPAELSEHWGPHHSPQGDMLIGTNGYEYDDYDYGQTLHRGATKNGCLDCHFDVRNSYFMGGHSFNMAYGGDDNTGACERCHSDIGDDFNRNFFGTTGIIDTVETLVGTLSSLLENAGLIMLDLESGEYHPVEDRVTSADSAGAVWNWLMAEEDQSHGVHNPQYTVDLLNSAVLFMQGTLSPQPAAAEQKRIFAAK